MFLLFIIGGIVAIVLLAAWPILSAIVRYFCYHRFRGPKNVPFAGHWRSFDLFNTGAYERMVSDFQAMTDKEHQMPSLVDVGLFFEGSRYYFACSADAMRTMLRDTTVFAKHPASYEPLIDVLGNGLVLSKGALWKRQRALLTPLFHLKKLRSYIPVMSAEAERFCDMLATEGKNGKVMFSEVPEYFAQYAFRVICTAVFADRVDMDYTGNLWTVATRNMMKVFELDAFLPRFVWSNLPLHAVQQYKSSLAKIDEHLLASIKKTRQANDTDAHDLIAQMANLKDDDGKYSIDDHLILSEAKTFLFAAQDTTSNTMSWAMYFLGKNRELQDQLADEYKRVVGDKPFTNEMLKDLKLADAVIAETLRLRPPVPSLDRLVTEDVDLDGFHLPKGSAVAMFFLGPQTDARHFEDPLSFKPERWLDGSLNGRHPFSYVPFSAGSRSCIGQKLAKHEQLVLLSMLCNRFIVETNPMTEVGMAFKGTVEPRGLKCRFKPRK